MATIRDELRPLADLQQHPRNYNRHHPGQVARMCDRMRHTSFTAPLIINEQGVILAGHLRRLALLQLKAESYPEPAGVEKGWQVPCRVFVGTEAQELAILAGDNQHPSEIDFDNEGLTALLAELQEQEALTWSGYDAGMLDRLIAEVAGSNGASSGEVAPPEDFPAYNEEIETEHECPKCGYRWSGGKASVPSADDGGD